MECKFATMEEINLNENIESDDTIYFVLDDNWNDYGNKISYFVYYKSKTYMENNYKILLFDDDYELEEKTCFLRINELNKKRGGYFISFCSNIDFYRKLAKELGAETLKEVLSTINDITVEKEKEEEICKELKKLPSEGYHFTSFKNRKQELIDNGLLRHGEEPYKLSEFCDNVGVDFASMLSGEIDLPDNKIFKSCFDGFIDGEFNVDDEEYRGVKEVVRGLKDVDGFLSSLESESLEKFVGKIKKDTNYYLDISKKAPKVLEKLSESTEESGESIAEAVRLIQKILKVQDKEKVPKNLGQYTTLDTLDYVLPNSVKDYSESVSSEEATNYPSLRLTNGNQLNDPMEGKVLFSYLEMDTEQYESTSNYLASATAIKDNLPLWKQYANDAKGAFTIFDKEFVETIVKEGCIYKICYLDPENEILSIDGATEKELDEVKQKLKEIKDKIKKKKDQKNGEDDLNKWRDYMDILKFLFKKSDYQYEKEYRILLNQESIPKIVSEKMKDEPWGYKLYTYLYDSNEKVEVKYSEIMIGPKSINNENYIAEYINFRDKSITVTSSKINYR